MRVRLARVRLPGLLKDATGDGDVIRDFKGREKRTPTHSSRARRPGHTQTERGLLRERERGERPRSLARE